MLRSLKLSHRVPVFIVIFSADFIIDGICSVKTPSELNLTGQDSE